LKKKNVCPKKKNNKAKFQDNPMLKKIEEKIDKKKV
jgi:hypothetical protein